MKRKMSLFIVIGLLLVVGIGWKVFMDIQKGKNEVNGENVKMHIAQEEIALYLVRNYIDVKKIEFHKFNEVKGVGNTSWSISVDVNEDNSMSFSMTDLSKVEDATVRHNPKTFRLNKRKEESTESLDGVEIIYYEGE
jgi:preprotein translocase subunit SecF